MAPIVSRGFRGRRAADVDPARVPPGQYGVPAVLRNATHGFIYTVSDSSGVRYSSGCVVVTLD